MIFVPRYLPTWVVVMGGDSRQGGCEFESYSGTLNGCNEVKKQLVAWIDPYLKHKYHQSLHIDPFLKWTILLLFCKF